MCVCVCVCVYTYNAFYSNLLCVFAEMLHKTKCIWHPVRLELTRLVLLVYLANYYTTGSAY